jgi:hypothetical protein
MTGNGDEPNRVLGFPVRPGRQPGQREEQHVMGFPASWFDDVNVDALVWLVHRQAVPAMEHDAVTADLTPPAQKGSAPVRASGCERKMGPFGPGILAGPRAGGW